MMTKTNNYIVAGCRPWNHSTFNDLIKPRGDSWHFVQSKKELSRELLAAIDPRYIFFWHWSWIVPQTIIDQYECVCFHMTDVPYGRGGSPLQNLIAKGHKETRLSALKMTDELDAGDVYLKEPLSLKGSAQKIYERATLLCAKMSLEIAQNAPTPKAQQGEPILFTRRTPEQSILPHSGNSTVIYDHIRMLDAEGYPHAFCSHGDFKLIFTDAQIENEKVVAKVTITRQAK